MIDFEYNTNVLMIDFEYNTNVLMIDFEYNTNVLAIILTNWVSPLLVYNPNLSV